MTLIVNLLAGPGQGKSTMASDLYNKLKKTKYETEFVTEYAKDLTYMKEFELLRTNQLFVSAEQNRRQWILDGKVDVIVTESPIFLGLLYYTDNSDKLERLFKEYLITKFLAQDNFNIYLESTHPYNPKGRNQNHFDAKVVHENCKNLLDFHKVPYITISSTEADYAYIEIVKLLRSREK